MGKKLFVGNLSFDTTNGELESLFAQIGPCDSAAIITDRATGRSRGFGFVEMSSSSDADRAIAELNGQVRSSLATQARAPSCSRPLLRVSTPSSGRVLRTSSMAVWRTASINRRCGRAARAPARSRYCVGRIVWITGGPPES